MDIISTKDPKDVDFWRKEAHEAASILVKRIDELRNQVDVNPKSKPELRSRVATRKEAARAGR